MEHGLLAVGNMPVVRTRRLIPWVVVALSVWLTIPVSGQSQARSPEARYSAGVNLVTLDVCVRDPAGRFVEGLRPEQFLVLENGAPQELAFFEASAPLPVHAVLLIDRSASMRGAKLERARAGALQFAGRLQPRDRLKVIAFNERVRSLSATAGNLAWGASLAALGATGSTALYDALVLAAHELARMRRDAPAAQTRDVIIVLSDGEDTASLNGFEEVQPLLRRSGALVYGLSLRAGENGRPLGASWPLLQLARDTGARAVSVPSLDALDRLYEEIDLEVRRMYRVGYVSSNGRPDGGWRGLSVRVHTPDAQVRTRAGYYAPRR